MTPQQFHDLALDRARRVLVDFDEPFRLLLAALVVGGNVLIEGVPGTAKTLMARCLAALLATDEAPATAAGRFQRIQFTPDLMPSDILGTNVFHAATATFTFRPGPIFANVVVADEINRAPAKTQSALLEAMEEHQVTIDGEPYALPEPFMVIATQNPIEYEGTYPLPEAQLDRFMFKLRIDYGPEEVEREVLARHLAGFDTTQLAEAGVSPVLAPDEVLACRRDLQQIQAEPGVLGYMTAIGQATRRAADLQLGSSVRGPLALALGARALAALRGRTYVTPDDVKELVGPALRHRVILKPDAEIEGLTPDDVLQRVLAGVEVPR